MAKKQITVDQTTEGTTVTASCQYEANLLKSDSRRNRESIALLVEEASISCDSQILQIKRDLAQLQRELSQAENAKDFNILAVIEAENHVTATEMMLEQAIEIKKRLFA
jgi:16S rRNA G1207 methylase RsmC